VAEARGQFRIAEKREHPPLEAVARRLVKAMTGDTSVRITVFLKIK
jgi:hypothetical protein